MTPERRRFLVIGLDGGTFDLLDPLFAAGKLPFLAAQVRDGFSAPLTSVFPPKTIPAWYSFATGLDPGTLGIFGFTEPDGGPGKSRLIHTYRPADALWDHLSRRGRTVGVLNFPLRTPGPVNGFFVPGMFSDDLQAYPADLAPRIRAELGAEPYLPELPPFRASDRAAWMELANRSVDQRRRVARSLIERYRPEFLFVLFRETDRIEHQHWAELSRPVGEFAPDLLSFWEGVDRALADIDAAFRAAGGPAVTLVISDHGHGAAVTDFFTNRWLLERGYLSFTNGGDPWRRRVVSRLLLGIDRVPGLTALLAPIADRLQGGRRRERFAQAMTGDASFETMAARIDWKRTVAFSYPVPEGIYLNPYGPPLTPERRAEIVARLRKELEQYPEARIEVFEPREIYRGVRNEQAPALLLRINCLETESRMDFAYPHPMLHHRPGYFYGSGVHRMDGILIASGAGVQARGRSPEAFSLLDIAPTVLEGMAVPVPAAMSGRSLAGRLAGTAV